jgi:hypothetical protein
MNLGLCPDRVERYHLLRMDINTMLTSGWFRYRFGPESHVWAYKL